MNKLITHCFILIFLFKISECRRNVYCYIGLFVCDYIDKNGEYFCFDEIKDMTTEIYEEYEAPISKNINDIYENTNEFMQNMSEIFSENINITMKQVKKKHQILRIYIFDKVNWTCKYISSSINLLFDKLIEIIKYLLKALIIMGIAAISKRFILKHQKLQMIYVVI